MSLAEYKHSIKGPRRVLLLIRKIGSNSQAIILCGEQGVYLYRNIGKGALYKNIGTVCIFVQKYLNRPYICPERVSVCTNKGKDYIFVQKYWSRIFFKLKYRKRVYVCIEILEQDVYCSAWA